jgi:GAF domain-containing protein/ketosteroid isomerase-like protein
MLAARYHQAFNARDFDIWREVLNDDVEIIIESTALRGVDAAVEYGVGIASQFPGLCISSERVVAEFGDTVVTEIGLADGDPAGGIHREATACEICRVRNGRIVSLRSYYLTEPPDRENAMERVGRAIGKAPAGSDGRGPAEERAVLRRVAALVGRVARPDELFAAVVEEVGQLLEVDFVVLSRQEREATQVSVGAWSSSGDVPFPVGTRSRLGEDDVVSQVIRTDRPARIDDYADASGEVAEAARRWGIHTAIGVPISVAGRLWGVMTVASRKREPLPADTEHTLAGFRDLVAALVANADARRELHSQAEEQAALRRVATLVASGAAPEDVFAAVAAEVGKLLAVDVSVLVRFDPDENITVVGTWTVTGAVAPTPVGSNLPLGGRNVTTIVFQTGEPARIEYEDASGAIGAAAKWGWRLRLSLGVPINVEGRLWGAMVVAFTREGVLPGDSEARLTAFTELVATALADAQARVKLRGYGDEQAALRRVATQVAGGMPPEDVFAAVAAEAGKLLDTDITSLSRYDPDDTTTVVGNWTRTGAASPSPVGLRTRVGGQNVTSLVQETLRPARLDNYENASGPVGQFSRSVGVRSAVGVPITVEGGLWGVMLAASITGEHLTADAETRLAGFTDLVGTAVANAQARMELRTFADEQAALRRVATLVAQAAPADDVFAAVVNEVGQLLTVDYALMSRYDADGMVTFVGVWSNEDPGRPIPVGLRVKYERRSVTTIVSETGRSARIDDYAASGLSFADAARDSGFSASVGVPIWVESRLWGVVIVASRTGPLAAGTEERLTGFTELVASAIANAQARMELRGFADEQAALRRVAILVAQSAAPAELFAAVTSELGHVLSVDVTSLSRFDADGTRTRVGSWSRTGTIPLPIGAREPLTRDNIAALVYRTSRPARLDGDGDPSDPLSNVARAFGIRSSVAVPVSVRGRLWGVMIAATQQEHPLPPETEVRLAGFTELVGTAIANAEVQTALADSRARVVAAADAARRRIERNLHDGAQQRLVSLILRLRDTERDAAPSAADESDEQLDDVVAELINVLGELRELARGVHPAALVDGGLSPALKTLARRSGIPVQLDLRIAGPLPEPIELAAYYVVAETLTNAAKHANATFVVVTATTGQERLRIEIVDDGCGGADLTNGSGLVGLSDRVEALGGQLVVTSPSGVGTTIEAVLPLATPVNRALPIS